MNNQEDNRYYPSPKKIEGSSVNLEESKISYTSATLPEEFSHEDSSSQTQHNNDHVPSFWDVFQTGLKLFQSMAKEYFAVV